MYRACVAKLKAGNFTFQICAILEISKMQRKLWNKNCLGFKICSTWEVFQIGSFLYICKMISFGRHLNVSNIQI